MNLLNPQPAASFDDPIAMLYACHGKVKRFCASLNALPDYFTQHGMSTALARDIGQIQLYFNQAAPLHHQDEEMDFFPLLQRYVPESRASIEQLAAEHDTLHQLWASLNEHLASLIAGSSKAANQVLIDAFTQAYGKHIPIEEALFELGSAHIPLDELQQIGSNMAKRRQH